MTSTQITLFFLLIISVIGISMVVHSWIDKRRIKKNFLRLTAELPGRVIQENRLLYPSFTGEVDGRRFDLFFNVVKVGRQHILYYIYSLQAAIPSDLLLLKSEYFKPISDEAQFTGQAGFVLPDLDLKYQVRSQHPEIARHIFEGAGIREHLPALEEFSSLQLGPDALVVGKPYDGPSDTEPGHILSNVASLQKLAGAIEQCTIPA